MFYQCTTNDDSDDMTITKFTCPPNTSYNEKDCKCDKTQSCSSDNTRSLKYLIEPRNMVISNNKPNVNKMHAYITDKSFFLACNVHFLFYFFPLSFVFEKTSRFRSWYRMSRYAHQLVCIRLLMMNVGQPL